jgi:hypothetical protein
MGRVYPLPDDAVSCRVCGATHARPALKEAFGMCETCRSAFDFRRPPGEMTEDVFLGLLAGKLALDIQRSRRIGMVGRCEAVSSWKVAGGYQCGNSATGTRRGRRVCGLHAKATAPVFVGEKQSNPYDAMSAMIRELCEADDEFRAAVESALRTSRRRAA